MSNVRQVFGWIVCAAMLVAGCSRSDRDLRRRLEKTKQDLEAHNQGDPANAKLLAALAEATPASLAKSPRLVEVRYFDDKNPRILAMWIEAAPSPDALVISNGSDRVELPFEDWDREENERTRQQHVLFNHLWAFPLESDQWRELRALLKDGQAQGQLMKTGEAVSNPEAVVRIQLANSPAQ